MRRCVASSEVGLLRVRDDGFCQRGSWASIVDMGRGHVSDDGARGIRDGARVGFSFALHSGRNRCRIVRSMRAALEGEEDDRCGALVGRPTSSSGVTKKICPIRKIFYSSSTLSCTLSV